MSEQGDGRDHNPYGFTMWFAGGGVKGGQTIGTTDEIGLHAVEDRLHVHDLHATVLASMGVDHMEMVYKHKGRPERATKGSSARGCSVDCLPRANGRDNESSRRKRNVMEPQVKEGHEKILASSAPAIWVVML